MRRRIGVATLVAALVATLALMSGTAAGSGGGNDRRDEMSGAADFRDTDFGTDISECPQAGLERTSPQPLDRRDRDRVEQMAARGDDMRMNQDYSCFPQDEMSIAINPLNTSNVVGGANDYRLAWGSSGFYSTTDARRHGNDNDQGHGNDPSWYDGIIPFPSLPDGDNLDGGGDPAVDFDRTGVAYWVDINFNRTDDTNGIFVSRSTNGGFTWSRPCVPIQVAPPPNEQSRCGGNGDPRTPGDGRVTYNKDNDFLLNGSVDFDDKEYVDVGPRPAGVNPTCFTPLARTPTACNPARVSPDRIYITWTRFNAAGTAADIFMSFSDDRAYSFSPARPILPSAPICTGGATGEGNCDDNQGSQPVVNPATGALYVAFENFNTPDENQYLLVRSFDGGATFQGPFLITPVFDVNYPTSGSGRPDCQARGQGGGRRVLTNSCFRVNARGAIAVDRRGGAYANDLYVIIADNRNGTRVSTNTDALFFKSVDGGTTWRGPTRVNDDPSGQPANRSCPRTGTGACPTNVHTGNDQFYPWLDIGPTGDIQAGWQDRRLDTSSTASEWPTSRTRPGNYLLWFWGGHCRVRNADSTECVAPTAGTITTPSGPINPDDSPFPTQTVFPFDNFGISDTPYNWDYAFRAGIFAGDYENVVIDRNNRTWAMWTDARNGRSSRAQTGRNPSCEQSDVWTDAYPASRNTSGQNSPRSSDSWFLVTPCPPQGTGHGDDDD